MTKDPLGEFSRAVVPGSQALTVETQRQRNRRLYGRPRVPRSHRRVMLALLTGAPGLSGYPLARLAQVGYGHVYVVLARMENRGLAEGKRMEGPYPQRRAYALTPEGRAVVTQLLGLPAEAA